MSYVKKQINYALTEDEFLRGFVHSRRRNKKRFWFFFCAILATVTLLNVDSISKESFDLSGFLSLNFIFLPCFFFTLYFLANRPLRKTKANFRASPFPRMEVTTKWDETGLTVTNPDGFQIYRWNDFSGWAEDNLIVTLFYAPGIYIPCPTRAFEDEQKRDFILQMKDAGLPRLKLMPF